MKSFRLGEWFLRIMARYYRTPSLVGDYLEEVEDIVRSKGTLSAYGWFWGHFLKSLPVFCRDLIYWRWVMFRNYLKVSWRNITKSKIHSLINILGLTVGLACCFYIFLWVKDELSYDRFNKNMDQLYRVYLEFPKESTSAFTSYAAPAAAEWLKTNIPEIKESARFRIVANRPQILVKAGENQFFEERFGFGDVSLFKLFTFPLLSGDINTIFSHPYSIILNESSARKYFGKENPVGKTVHVENQFDFIVTGIMKDIPQQSHLHFDFLVPFENIVSFMPEYGKFLHRHNLHFFRTYILVEKNASIPALKEKVSKYLSIKFDVQESEWRHHLQPVKEIHLRTRGIKDLMKRGDFRYIYIFSLTGILILLIACINFMNLTTARSSIRAKEVGMRKVAGAGRKNLVGQFLGESILSSMIAMVLAGILVFISLPAFKLLSGKTLSLDMASNKGTILGLFLITLFTGILSGSYPAVYLSSFQPVRVLKGNAGFEKGKGFFRKILVVSQFVIAVGLIICTIIIYNQYKFLKNKYLGFNKEHVVYAKLDKNLKEKFGSLKNEILKDHGVVHASASSRLLTDATDWTGDFYWEGKEEQKERLSFIYTTAGYDFIETYKMNIVQGRSFSKDIPKKPNEEYIINEAAAEFMNVESPVGLPVNMSGTKGTIIGVVQDFNYQSLHQKIKPLVLTNDPQNFQFLHVRIRPDNITAVVGRLTKICQAFEPGFPVEFHFADEAFDILYRSEEQMGHLFNCFAVFAVFIACLGLFGLSMFVAESRFREIGIRKALGASVSSIMRLISKEFVGLVLLANVIAWPIVYFAMNRWLQNFAYRINLNAGTFLLSGFLVFALSLITVSYQSVKAALSNPVDSLRYE
ncbi:MAG: ABC transporter permease [Candidatus Aminicenantes bacterium]|nr:ABC transporter permease [Candidatus Aminicenantes bacterium]